MHAQGDRLVFALPPGTRQVRLVLDSRRPSDARPWLDDRRRLGIAVARLTVSDADQVIDLPLDGDALGAGWHAGETGARWTDGDAELTLPPYSLLHGQVGTGSTRLQFRARDRRGLLWLQPDRRPDQRGRDRGVLGNRLHRGPQARRAPLDAKGRAGVSRSGPDHVRRSRVRLHASLARTRLFRRHHRVAMLGIHRSSGGSLMKTIPRWHWPKVPVSSQTGLAEPVSMPSVREA